MDLWLGDEIVGDAIDRKQVTAAEIIAQNPSTLTEEFVGLLPGSTYTLLLSSIGELARTATSINPNPSPLISGYPVLQTFTTEKAPFAPPQNLTATVQNDIDLLINWSEQVSFIEELNHLEVPTTINYTLAYYPVVMGQSAVTTINDIVGSSHLLSDLEPNTEYAIALEVSAQYYTTGRAEINVRTQRQTPTPIPNEAFTIIPDQGIVEVLWRDLPAEVIAINLVLRSDLSNVPLAQIQNVNATEGLHLFRDLELLRGENYTVGIEAILDETRFNPLPARTLSFYLGNINLVNNDSEQVEIAWDKISNASRYRYRFYIQTETPPDFSEISLASEANARIDTDALEPGTTYIFEVIAQIDGFVRDSVPAGSLTFATALAPPSIEYEFAENSVLGSAWFGVANADSYLIEVYVGDDDSGSLIERVLSNETSYISPETLQQGTQHTLYITARNDARDFPDSRRLKRSLKTAGQDLIPLATPVIESVAVQSTLISVQWQAVEGAVSYKLDIYRSETQENDAFASETLNASEGLISYTFNDLAPGAEHTLRIIAVGDELTTSNSRGALHTVKTDDLAIEGLTLNRNNAESIALSWRGFPFATGYQQRIYRTNQQDLPDFDAVLGSNPLSIVIQTSQLTPNTAYTFEVIALGVHQLLAVTPTATIELNTALATPEIASESIATNSLSFSWSPILFANGYLVEVYWGETINSAFVYSEQVLTPEVEIENLFPGAQYTVSIRATDRGDTYPDSNALILNRTTFGQLASRLATPTIQSRRLTPFSITVSWALLASAPNGYEVHLYRGDRAVGTPLRRAFIEDENEYTFERLEHATQYTVRVIALGDGVDMLNSRQSIETVTTPSPRVQNIRIVQNDFEEIQLAWDSVPNSAAYYYRIYRAGQLLPDFREVVGQEQTALTINTSDLDARTEYTFEVVATGAGVGDVNALPRSSIRLNTALQAPIFSASSVAGDDLTIVWLSAP
ncbi:MAG: fibronectin type III domain-containing protein, partial [Candidatus Oxydemutatoraceae bacterium WSBS_2016_MAG_OTU14]